MIDDMHPSDERQSHMKRHQTCFKELLRGDAMTLRGLQRVLRFAVWCRLQGLGLARFRAQGFGFAVWCRLQGLGLARFRAQGFGFAVWCRLQGLGLAFGSRLRV